MVDGSAPASRASFHGTAHGSQLLLPVDSIDYFKETGFFCFHVSYEVNALLRLFHLILLTELSLL